MALPESNSTFTVVGVNGYACIQRQEEDNIGIAMHDIDSIGVHKGDALCFENGIEGSPALPMTIEGKPFLFIPISGIRGVITVS